PQPLVLVAHGGRDVTHDERAVAGSTIRPGDGTAYPGNPAVDQVHAPFLNGAQSLDTSGPDSNRLRPPLPSVRRADVTCVNGPAAGAGRRSGGRLGRAFAPFHGLRVLDDQGVRS